MTGGALGSLLPRLLLQPYILPATRSGRSSPCSWGLHWRSKRAGCGGFKNALIGVAIGTALAGIQLIPTMVYFREVSRATGLDSLDRVQWALSPWRIIEFIVPGFFGSAAAGLEKWPVFMWLGGQIQTGFELPFVPSVFVGAGVLVLAAGGVSRSRSTRILGISSLILLWLALGTNAGAEQLTHLIPVWGKFRYSEKMVGPLTLCLSVLAAFGAERLSERPARFWAVLAGGAGLAALASALFLGNWLGFDTLFTDTVARGAAPVVRHNLTIGLMHAGLTLLALVLLLIVARRRPQFRIYFPAAVAGLVFLQSSFAAPFVLHSGERAVRDDHPLSQIADSRELPRILTPIEKNYLYPEGVDQFDGQIGAQSHLGAPAYNVPSRIDQVNTYTGLRPRRLDMLIRQFNDQFGFDSPIAFRLYAVTHMIIKDPYFPDEAQVAKAASQDGVKVLDNREWGFTGWKVPHRPWAIFAEKVAIASNEKDALDTLVKTLAREETTVVLEGAPQPKTLGAGQVLEIERESNRLRIDAASPSDGILVVNDSFWPGWRATIDGNEVPIWRADFLVRAIPWPAGRHVLEMKYDPPEVRLGWLVSLTGALALAALSFFEWRKKRSAAITKRQKGKQSN